MLFLATASGSPTTEQWSTTSHSATRQPKTNTKPKCRRWTEWTTTNRTIPAGETVELTWTFGDEGIVLIGCHQPGHYDAGMTGRITVEG